MMIVVDSDNCFNALPIVGGYLGVGYIELNVVKLLKRLKDFISSN